jgi:hypothetical protein
MILMDDEPGLATSDELNSQFAIAVIVIGFLGGLTLLVVVTISLYKCAFRVLKKKRTIDESLGLEDESGSGTAQERLEAMQLIRDQQRS